MNFVDLMNLPCAHGGPAGSARLRVAPEDFVVREWLGFDADGEGDHLLLKVRKRGANTMWVAKQLARIGKIHPRDVGFAGYWTLEMFAVQPIRIYPGVPICQIFYHQITGSYTEYCSDKYQHNRDIQPSLLYRELNPGSDRRDPQLTLSFGNDGAG